MQHLPCAPPVKPVGIQCCILQSCFQIIGAFTVENMMFDGINFGYKVVESVFPCILNCGCLPVWNGHCMDGVSVKMI